MAMSYVPIKFWDWRNNLSLGAKCSPMDGTLEQWNYILANEIRSIEELTEEEDEI
jgi:hypothetical protein